MSIYYRNPPNALRSSYAHQAKGYSDYECELSIHLAAHFLCARPRLADDTLFFSEKAHSRAISRTGTEPKKGRGPKPLTPSSTPRGKEVNSMGYLLPTRKDTTSVRRISKEALVGESEKPPPHSCETRPARRELLFGFGESELAQLFTTDEYGLIISVFRCPL